MKLVLIRGVPGTGKSTYAKRILNAAPDTWRHCEADMFFEALGGFDPSKLKDAHEWCQNSTDYWLSQNNNVIVSNTFIKRWEVQPYLDMAEKYDADVVVKHMTVEHGSIHDVPQATIDRMRGDQEVILDNKRVTFS